jgi:hypothetical protein
VQRELHVLRLDGELARHQLRRRVEPEAIQSLDEGQPLDGDEAPRIAVAVWRSAHIESRRDHAGAGGGLRENLDDDAVTVAGERSLERLPVAFADRRAPGSRRRR